MLHWDQLFHGVFFGLCHTAPLPLRAAQGRVGRGGVVRRHASAELGISWFALLLAQSTDLN